LSSGICQRVGRGEAKLLYEVVVGVEKEGLKVFSEVPFVHLGGRNRGKGRRKGSGPCKNVS